MLVQTTTALHRETSLRAQHDLLYAQLYTGSTLPPLMRQRWNDLYVTCSDALNEFSMPWFVESVTRIIVSALQATEQYDLLIKKLRRSPLPKREQLLQTAICHMALRNVDKAASFAIRARELFAKGTRNWFIASDIATRALLLEAKTNEAAAVLQETRLHPSALAHDTNLKIGRKLVDAYCTSLDNLLYGSGPRRGRPPAIVRGLLEEIRAGSLARHFFIAAHVWLLIESKAQRNYSQFDDTLVTLWRFLKRRKELRENSRFGVFVDFLYRHRNTPPKKDAQKLHHLRLVSMPGAFTDSEIVRFEILGRLLIWSESQT